MEAAAPFNSGTVSGLLSYGGDAYLAGADMWLLPPSERDTAFVRGEFKIAPALTLFAEGGYGDADSTYHVRYYQREANIAISRQNAFLVRSDCCAYGRAWVDLVRARQTSHRSSARVRSRAAVSSSAAWWAVKVSSAPVGAGTLITSMARPTSTHGPSTIQSRPTTTARSTPSYRTAPLSAARA